MFIFGERSGAMIMARTASTAHCSHGTVAYLSRQSAQDEQNRHRSSDEMRNLLVRFRPFGPLLWQSPLCLILRETSDIALRRKSRPSRIFSGSSSSDIEVIFHPFHVFFLLAWLFFCHGADWIFFTTFSLIPDLSFVCKCWTSGQLHSLLPFSQPEQVGRRPSHLILRE